MPSGVTFNSLEEANEFIETLKAEGMNGKVVHDRNTGKHKVHIVARHIPEASQELPEHREPPVRGSQIGSFAKWVGKGIKDVGQSLGTPSTNQRPKIAQLPSKRGSIGVAQRLNLEYMKPRELRGKTISGRPRDTSD